MSTVLKTPYDAITAAIYLSLTHLDKQDSYARMLFIDFNSTQSFHSNHRKCNWFSDFLTRRSQSIRICRATSSTAPLNTTILNHCHADDWQLWVTLPGVRIQEWCYAACWMVWRHWYLLKNLTLNWFEEEENLHRFFQHTVFEQHTHKQINSQ